MALQLRNLQSLVEIAVDRNSTVAFPAPLMSTIGELGSFLARESAGAARNLADAEHRAVAGRTSSSTERTNGHGVAGAQQPVA